MWQLSTAKVRLFSIICCQYILPAPLRRWKHGYSMQCSGSQKRSLLFLPLAACVCGNGRRGVLAVAEYLRGIVVRHGNICRKNKKSPLPSFPSWANGLLAMTEGRKTVSSLSPKNILLSWAQKDERNGKSIFPKFKNILWEYRAFQRIFAANCLY